MFQSWILQAIPESKPRSASNKPEKTKNRRSKAKTKPASTPGVKARIFLLGESEGARLQEIAEEHGAGWEKSQAFASEKEFIQFSGEEGPVWVLRPKESAPGNHQGLLQESFYSKCRDLFGTVAASLKATPVSELHLFFWGTHDMMELGAFVGLELATYSFKDQEKTFRSFSKIQIFYSKDSEFDESIIKRAQGRAVAVNLARHWVNMPPNLKTPPVLAQAIKNLKWSRQTKIEIWNEQKLKQEKCHLILAVGQGSATPPRLVKISYRPTRKTSQGAAKPLVAFVGKGITFDSGGLDIKPSSAMRLMKKDMGGAASTLGLAYWVDQSKYDGPVDFYLAIAENAVDGNSMRPSDVYVSRSGIQVEIDNTDAEGRLVLADALHLAATSKANPDCVINMATLTGACRVALGVELAGLFSNNDELADEIQRAGNRAGDLNWRLPLVDRYFSSYSSSFADFKNGGESFGGAITAALFLQKFVQGKKWAHLDMYSWSDRPLGPLHFAGGNGQSVQALIEWLESR
jgi:leucyl aminopeptidase